MSAFGLNAVGLVIDSALGKTCVQGWGWVLSLISTTNCILAAIIVFFLKAIPRGSGTLSEVCKFVEPYTIWRGSWKHHTLLWEGPPGRWLLKGTMKDDEAPCRDRKGHTRARDPYGERHSDGRHQVGHTSASMWCWHAIWRSPLSVLSETGIHQRFLSRWWQIWTLNQISPEEWL